MNFGRLPKEKQFPVTFNGHTRFTGKSAILTKVSNGFFKKPEETIIRACLNETGEEVQTRVLGLENASKVISQLDI